MSDNTTNMRKLMESINPVMDMEDMPVDNMGAMDNNGDMGEYDPNMGSDVVDAGIDAGMDTDMDMGSDMGSDMEVSGPAVSTDIIDALEGEFKRLTTEYLQTDGELDEVGLSDIREKLGKHMTSILDVLHSGWMDNMMDQAGAAEEAPDFGGESGDDDHEGETDSDDKDETDSDDDKEESNSDDNDSDDKDDDKEESDSDDSDDKDGDDDKESEFNFDEAHLNEGAAIAMRKLQDKMLKG